MKRNKLSIPVIVFYTLLTAVFVAMLSYNHYEQQALTEDIANMSGQPPAVGSELPSFQVRTLRGKLLASQDLVGRELVILLWSIGCHPSVWALEAILDLEIAQEVDLIALNLYDTSDAILEFTREKGWDLPILTDVDKSVKWAFKANVTPALYTIDSQGTITHRQLGLSKQGIEFLARKFR